MLYVTQAKSAVCRRPFYLTYCFPQCSALQRHSQNVVRHLLIKSNEKKKKKKNLAIAAGLCEMHSEKPACVPQCEQMVH